MRFEEPNLDDRKFKDLVEEALQRIPQYTKDWTDLNYTDPGRTLIELFAYMTETLIYRLNRVPEKHYIRFMDLVGLEMQPAAPAETNVSFWLSKPQDNVVEIPPNTVVSTTRTETEPAITFTTDNDQAVNILIPHISEIYTASDGQRDKRQSVSEQLKNIGDGVSLFSSKQIGDTFYIEFTENLSNHIIGINMELSEAEGAGVNPNSPPYVWEARTSDAATSWQVLDVDGEDGTKALNTSGTVRLFLPPFTGIFQSPYQIRCRLTDNVYQVSPKIKKITVVSWGITIPATNIARYQYEVLGRSDGLPGQTYRLQHSPIVSDDGDALYLQFSDGRKDERWERRPDFSSSTKEDRHFTLDKRTGEVRFGPALRQSDGSIKEYGAIPPRGALIAMRSYKAGGGIIGNLPPRAINVLKTSIPYIDRVTNRIAATGGMDAETLENAKMRVPGHLRSLQRAVTSADFEYLSKQVEGVAVGRVHCLQTKESLGKTTLLVVPAVANPEEYITPESLRLPEKTRESILAYLDERRMLSSELEVSEPNYQWVQVEVKLRPNQLVDTSDVIRMTEAKLYAYLNPLTGGSDHTGWPFGRDLYKSDITAVLMGVPGVDFIRSVKLVSMLRNAAGEFTKQNTDEIDVISVQPRTVIVSYRHKIELDDISSTNRT